MHPSNLQPLNRRVLVKRAKIEKTRTGAGLFIPDAAQEPPTEGVIVARAEDCNASLALGCEVMFGKFSGVKLGVFDDDDFLLLQEDEIFGVFSASALKGTGKGKANTASATTER